jgi:ribokinase
LDPADIETRKEEFRDTLKNLNNTLDVLSINENECTSLIKACNLDSKLSLDFEDTGNIKQAAKLLSFEFGLEIDLHTRIGGAWSDGKDIQFVKSFDVVPKKLTGSGDCWDAADILGHLSHLDANERLMFSNSYASLYVSRSDFEPPTIDDAVDFAQKSI